MSALPPLGTSRIAHQSRHQDGLAAQPDESPPPFTRGGGHMPSADGGRPGEWLRAHLGTPVRQAAHGVRALGHEVRQTVRLFGNRHAGAGQAFPSAEAMQQQPPLAPMPVGGPRLQPIPNLHVGDPAVRLTPPPIYFTGWSQAGRTTREIPVTYVQRQSPMPNVGGHPHDDLITYF